MRIRQVMSAPVIGVSLEDTAGDAWNRMQAHSVRHLVVFGEAHALAGVISAGDLGGRHGAAVREGRTVTDLMSRHVVTIRPQATPQDAANTMRSHLIECLPVVEAGEVIGMVTSLDLLELFATNEGKALSARRADGVAKSVGRAGREN